MDPNTNTLSVVSGVKPQAKRTGKNIEKSLQTLVRKEVQKLTAKMPGSRVDKYGNSTAGIIDPTTIQQHIELYNKTKDLQSKEDALVDFMNSNAVAKQHRQLTALSKQFIAGDPEVTEAIQGLEKVLNPFANIRGKTLEPYGYSMQDKMQSKRYANAALNDFIAAKFNLPMEEALQLVKDAEVTIDDMTNKGITHRKIKELLAIDDWSTVARYAAPLLMKYTPQAAKWAWDKYILPKISSWSGGDEGFITEDSVDPMIAFKRSYLTGFNREVTGVRNVDRAEFKHPSTSAGVSTHSLKTHLCPEYYVHRQTTKYPEKTAVGSFMQEINVTTNTAGAALIFICPGCFANTGLTAPYTSVYNANTFSPDTMNQIGIPNAYTGPVSSILSTVSKRVRLCGFSLQVVPIVSYNTAGYIQLSYFSTSMTGSPGAPITEGSGYIPSDLSQAPYYSAGNNKTVYRMIALPNNQTIDGWTNPVGTDNLGTDTFAIMFTGFPSTVAAAKIQVFMTFEFIPRSNYNPICALSFPQQGPLTNEFLSAILARFPILQSLTNQDAKRFTDDLPDHTLSYDHLMQIVTDYARTQSTPPVQPIETTRQQPPVASMASFDIE